MTKEERFVVNPLQKFLLNPQRSGAAWAMGSGARGGNRDKYKMAGSYQALPDCLARNVAFWRCYSRELKVKYVFFAERDRVAKIRFDRLLTLVEHYAPTSELPLTEKRDRAEELLSFLVFK